MPNLLLVDFNPDWKLLREQKNELLNLVENTDLDAHHEAIAGITNLIDFIQDQAVESGIWHKDEVFECREDEYFLFAEKYKPIKNHIDTNASFDGDMFETFGEEVEYVRTYPDQKKVWTLIEADGKQYISAGYHHVNRLGYFITEIAWETGNEEFYSD